MKSLLNRATLVAVFAICGISLSVKASDGDNMLPQSNAEYSNSLKQLSDNVAETFTLPADTTKRIYTLHALVKDQYVGAFSTKAALMKVKSLYGPTPDTTVWRFGANQARMVYDQLLNKHFAKAGHALTTAEKIAIIDASIVSDIPTDYATNPAYLGKIERYSNNGTVNLFTRKLRLGEKWATYNGTPWLIMDCFNGYQTFPVLRKTFKTTSLKDLVNPSVSLDYNLYEDASVTQIGLMNINGSNNSVSVVISPQPDLGFVAADKNFHRGWFARNACWVVPVGIVVIGGVVYAIVACKSHHDNTYDNGFQGGSGSSGASGGTGSQQTWNQTQQQTATARNGFGRLRMGPMVTPQGKLGMGAGLAFHL